MDDPDEDFGTLRYEVREAFDIQTMAGKSHTLRIGDPVIYAAYSMGRRKYVSKWSDLKKYWNYFTLSEDDIMHNCRPKNEAV